MGFETRSCAGVALMLWSCEPEQPHRLPAPFLCASVAAAMDMPVEIYFTGRSVRLLKPGVAASLRGDPLAGRTVYDVMQETAEHGALFMACTEALRMHSLLDEPLIPECIGRGGLVQFMARAADPTWRTLVF